jgi:isopentenyl-diphosphate Delta-isomerase
MNHKYYQEELFLAEVDQDDQIINRVERWEAHKKGILHRGFTAILIYQDQIILQHRKHLAFDNIWDFTFSSHQIYVKDKLETGETAVIKALNREWGIGEKDIVGGIQSLGSVYYRAKDNNSIYTEHEIDYIYSVEIDKLPKVNFDFAYGYETISKNKNIVNQCQKYILTPWVEKILQTDSIIKYFIK